jgi:hypothetical protein
MTSINVKGAKFHTLRGFKNIIKAEMRISRDFV